MNMIANSNIVLVGFMGTGKTVVGKRIAQRLNMTFLDMDDIIEKRQGKSIPDIFAEDGEPHFRAVERKLVRELSARTGLVIGAGGGIVLDPDNISDYSKTGKVVCLSATPEVILERVAKDTNRPLLASDDKMRKILDLLESRQKFYDAIPCQVDTTKLSIEEVANKILALRVLQMNILITGGAGFIGSHLVERLLERGDTVVVLDNMNDYYDPRIKEQNLEQAMKSPNMIFIKGDILDAGLLEKIFAENSFDVIAHMAARAGVRASLEQPILYEEVNCRGTLNLLELTRKHDIKRFVFASSSSVYGNVRDIPFREDAEIDRPISPYAATKAAGELYCHIYYNLYGISVTALRFFTVYGARQRPDMAIHKFTALIDQGKPVPFYGDGDTARDYTYYTDIIDGVLPAIDRDLGFEIINLGESRTTTLSRLVNIIEETLGRKAILNRLPMQPGDVTITCADVSKAKRLLDYNPSTTIEDGITRFVEWYKRQSR